MFDGFEKHIAAGDKSLRECDMAGAMKHYNFAMGLMLSLEQSHASLAGNRETLGSLFFRCGLAAFAHGMEIDALADVSAALGIHRNRGLLLCVLATIRAVSEDHSVRNLASSFHCARLSECCPVDNRVLCGFATATLALSLCNSGGFDEARETLRLVNRNDIHVIPGFATITEAVESQTTIDAATLNAPAWIFDVLNLEQPDVHGLNHTGL